MAELTPMKRQYYEIKQRNPDCLLFFRLGDFYEMFDDDARLAARELDLTLTTRDRNVEDPAERTPMCGVPYHSAEAYIGRLIAKGYKVAICEQMEDPALAKGLVERDIIRIITPGTVTESSMLEENKSNYLGAVYLSAQSGGTAFCDLSTGEFCAASYPADAVSHILNELGRFAPREAVCADAAAENDDIRTFLTKRLGSLVEAGGDRFEYMAAAARVCEQFDVQSTDELGLGEAPAAVCAAGALLAYLHETQKCDLGHIRRLELLGDDHYMELDYTTRRNLELTENLRSGEKRGSLLWVLDKTKTPMGGRLLRTWVERPLLRPLPAEPFEVCEWVYGRKVQANCHVAYARNYYSVSHLLVGSTVDLRVTEGKVEVFSGGERVATHPRFPSYARNRYSTRGSDMPEGRAWSDWDAPRIRAWASRVGPSCSELVDRVFACYEFDEQGFNAALAVLRLSRRYTPARLERACGMALATGKRSPRYRDVEPVLRSGQDRAPAGEASGDCGYVRGAGFYGEE